ncbi:hypothetical protein [Amycolatopsis sp. NPDC051102]|uniref:hypothetical protein n=1 Tax=Amycolatopsis sp. NPDC051102 TaxID=3155163 RepID=UPI00342868BF
MTTTWHAGRRYVTIAAVMLLVGGLVSGSELPDVVPLPYAYLTGTELVVMHGDHVVGRAPVQYDISLGDLIATADGRYFAVLSGKATQGAEGRSPQLVAINAETGHAQIRDCATCNSIAPIGGSRVMVNTNEGFLRFDLSSSKLPLSFQTDQQPTDRLRLLSGTWDKVLVAGRDPIQVLKEAYYVLREDGSLHKIDTEDRPEAHAAGPAYGQKYVIGRSAATILPTGEARFAVSTAARRRDLPCAVEGDILIFSANGRADVNTNLAPANHAHIWPGIDGALAALDLWWDTVGDLHAIVLNDTCGADNVGEPTSSLSEWRFHDAHWLQVSTRQTRALRQLSTRSNIVSLPRTPGSSTNEDYDLYLYQDGNRKKIADGVDLLATRDTTAPRLEDSCHVNPANCPSPDLIAARRQLSTAPVPSLCEHPAGTLVNGSLPGIPDNQGSVFLAANGSPMNVIDSLAVGDLTGDGVAETAAVLGCSQGGVSWPEYIVVYTPEKQILGSIDLGDIALAEQVEHADIERLKFQNGNVLLTFMSYNGAIFCAKKWSAKLHWDGHDVTMQDLTQAKSIPTVPC